MFENWCWEEVLEAAAARGAAASLARKALEKAAMLGGETEAATNECARSATLAPGKASKWQVMHVGAQAAAGPRQAAAASCGGFSFAAGSNACRLACVWALGQPWLVVEPAA